MRKILFILIWKKVPVSSSNESSNGRLFFENDLIRIEFVEEGDSTKPNEKDFIHFNMKKYRHLLQINLPMDVSKWMMNYLEVQY
jgi:hypothetical protein